ncbi:MAG: methylenetetrahydrofolate reductase [NAD(P)H] [Omnitrophica bacterium RIFCSPHIGHO2_02_FULL_46_11]|nr:MAG: methylenetetrahydrofolate reductase [NAD(P)H] [Omnitrophica bacterium RIFCSPHIGHO2_02_FULL_46_11]
MKIADCYRTKKHTFSFEFFPPKTDEGETKLFQTITQLKSLHPSFVSVTYGAMGTTRDNTIRIVEKIKNEIGLEAAAHLTCVGHTQDDIEAVLAELHERGVENIVALRGDPPKGETEFKPVPNGFRYGSELVRFIRKHPKYGKAFSLAVAGYPEGHIECKDKGKDLQHLKQKVDGGADVVITQLFFNNRDFFDFVDRCRKIGITIPIVAGIMPVTHGPQIQRFASMCGASIPKVMQEAIQEFGENQSSVEAFGIEYATKQCRELLDSGIPGIHFYTLNKSHATERIYTNLGLAQSN